MSDSPTIFTAGVPESAAGSGTHVVIIPSYNAGPRLAGVVSEVLAHWRPVIVVDDGTTDGSVAGVLERARSEPGLTVLRLDRNRGKGAAVLAGAEAALARGFSHGLVMDADGQHPAGSIREFMAASLARPGALVLGRPLFPANIPRERLHGRKLSNGIVKLEILGPGIDDTLFGFRVYPLAALVDVFNRRSGGRRYDFDTEAAVCLCWAGVPPVNLAAPVRYFERSEGGISHFHYVRDNLRLVWMHTRLIVELLLVRWPALRRHRKAWKTASRAAALVALFFAFAMANPLPAAAGDALVAAENRLSASTPGWAGLFETLADKEDTIADFTERRVFPFRKEATELAGEVRVSKPHGISLRYTEPEQRIVILDDDGILVRDAGGEKAMSSKRRDAAANAVLLDVLRFDFAALEQSFEIFGRKDDCAWELALVPRTDEIRRSVGRITVEGEESVLRRIELRRSAKSFIEIAIAPPHEAAPFTPEELGTYFRMRR
ncbi:MAG TPA: glycosyltransferase [Opitutaceae bacterium]